MRDNPQSQIDFGSFSSTTPLSRDFGFDRGRPIDRYYIDRFIERHAADIRGHALEVEEATYCRKFGAGRVKRQEVLHLLPTYPGATLSGDLATGGVLPEGELDCIVITQTLQLIFDVQAAVAEIHRGLKRGGVALVTVPGISQLDADEWDGEWCWSFTPTSARRLFGAVFGSDNVKVESFGNVYAATAFLQGLAVDEVNSANLNVNDRCYPMIVTVRAVRGR